jgi:hypothetical protein
MDDQQAFAIAVAEAKAGYKEGGVPVSNLSNRLKPSEMH